jgi:hypothetical protein
MADEKKVCEHCGKPGGRVIIDPYQKEINGEEVKMRLHKQCEQERINDV